MATIFIAALGKIVGPFQKGTNAPFPQVPVTFFAAFSSLGYSAIVLVIAVIFVALLAFNTLGMPRRPLWMRVAFLAVFIVAIVPLTIFLAEERVKVMDGFREEGGPKPRLPPKP